MEVLPIPYNKNIQVLDPDDQKNHREFGLLKAEFVTLKIYNILGQEVTTLVLEKLQPGSYKYSWDARSFVSDVYIYKMQTEEGFTKTKKLLLIK